MGTRAKEQPGAGAQLVRLEVEFGGPHCLGGCFRVDAAEVGSEFLVQFVEGVAVAAGPGLEALKVAADTRTLSEIQVSYQFC